MPISRAAKAKFVRTAVLPKALYGCETTKVTDEAGKKGRRVGRSNQCFGRLPLNLKTATEHGFTRVKRRLI